MRIDFRTRFLNWYKIPLWFFFRTCFASAISVMPRGTCEVPAEVPEDSRVLRARRLCTQPPIASTPGSSPPERPGLDNVTSQPWSEATCHLLKCLLPHCHALLLKKARQSRRSGVTGARCDRPWLTRAIVWTGLFRRGWARFPKQVRKTNQSGILY